MSEKEKVKVSEEAEKFFEFMNGPAVSEKINQYIRDNEKYDGFKEAVKKGEIALICSYGNSGWSAFGTDEGIQHRLFNIIQSALKHKVVSEKELCSMVAFICAAMRKEKEDEKEE
jgi:hypothetical protein